MPCHAMPNPAMPNPPQPCPGQAQPCFASPATTFLPRHNYINNYSYINLGRFLAYLWLWVYLRRRPRTSGADPGPGERGGGWVPSRGRGRMGAGPGGRRVGDRIRWARYRVNTKLGRIGRAKDRVNTKSGQDQVGSRAGTESGRGPGWGARDRAGARWRKEPLPRILGSTGLGSTGSGSRGLRIPIPETQKAPPKRGPLPKQ